MATPEIYLSAGPELTAARTIVKKALQDLGAMPVELTDFTVPYGPLEGVLSQMIGRCSVVIHLVGPRFGLEPSERTLGAPRRSFPQYEIDVAISLGKPIYYFAASSGCTVQPYPPESDESREMQRQHRRAIEGRAGKIPEFARPEELKDLVLARRRDFVARQRLAWLPCAALGERFVGRRRLLATLDEEVKPGRAVVISPAAEGDVRRAGAGATTLAVEFAWSRYEAREFDYVILIPAGPRSQIESAIAGLARQEALGLLGHEVANHRARWDTVIEWFADAALACRALVIFDGIDNPAEWLTIRQMLPHFAQCAVLLTTRIEAWPGFTEVRLPAFSLENATEFLAGRLPAYRGSTAAGEIRALERLADCLDCLPTNLSLLAGYLVESKILPSEFAQEWAPDFRDLENTVRQLTVDRLTAASVAALSAEERTILYALACLAPDPAGIPYALFDHRGDWPEIRRILQVLENRCLIARQEDGRTMVMPSAVRQAIRDGWTEEKRGPALAAARAGLEAAFRQSESGAGGPALRERIIPHCRAFLGQITGDPMEQHAGYLVQHLADWLKNCGRIEEAEPLYRRALSIEERVAESGHSRNLILRLRDLAGLLRGSRRMAEGEALYRRAAQLSEQEHGPAHLEVAIDLASLAGCLRSANRLEEAETLCRRALAIEENRYGESHPRISIALNRLAGILEIERQYREAEALYRRALKIDEGVAGGNHPRIVATLHNLAAVLMSTRHFREAEELYRRALAIDEEKFGPTEPEVSPALKSLAYLLAERGNVDEAIEYLRRAWQIDERSFGPDHLETAFDLCNLAGMLASSAPPEEVEAMFRRALEIFVAQRIRLRGEYPHLPPAAEKYAAFLRAQGLGEEEVESRVANSVPVSSSIPRRIFLAKSIRNLKYRS